MRLKTNNATANERIIQLVNSGYAVLNELRADYSTKKEKASYNNDVDLPTYRDKINSWGDTVITCLNDIFPTELEQNTFLNPNIPFGAVSGDYEYQSLMKRFTFLIKGLEEIRTNSIPQYTDLPIQTRLYIEDIDSFQKVRDVNPAMVNDKLKNGFIDLSEDKVQVAIEQILNVSFHKKDWGGEFNDLYTANVVVNGTRRSTAFLLKGNGIGNKEMTIADCGKNGDQIVRLFSVAADLFIIQFVGNISDMVIKDIELKVLELKSRNIFANYLIMDGQDTARILLAYGKL